MSHVQLGFVDIMYVRFHVFDIVYVLNPGSVGFSDLSTRLMAHEEVKCPCTCGSADMGERVADIRLYSLFFSKLRVTGTCVRVCRRGVLNELLRGF